MSSKSIGGKLKTSLTFEEFGIMRIGIETLRPEKVDQAISSLVRLPRPSHRFA